jgi:hypothetical protein
MFPYGGGMIVSVTPERLAKIFLEDPKDKTKFLRANSIEEAPFNTKDVFGKNCF